MTAMVTKDFNEAYSVRKLDMVTKDGIPLKVIVGKIKDIEPLLKAEFAIKTIGVFGSYASGTQTRNSDLDLLVTFNETPSLFDFIRLKILLTEKLGINVDLVMEDTLKERLKIKIIREVIYL